MSTVNVKIQWGSMQFSDTGLQHRHDAAAVFKRAKDRHVWFAAGTEAGDAAFAKILENAAESHGFVFFCSDAGEWVAGNKSMLHSFRHGFEGPYIEGTHGLSAAEGGHNPRGIAWLQGEWKEADIGNLTMGAAHYLTQGSVKAGNVDNTPLTKGIGKFGRDFGAGKDKVFIGADANEHDNQVDVFEGQPFTTLGDELGKWPGTHPYGNKGKATAIDIVATYDHDKKVKAKSWRALDDKDIKLFTDHYLTEAVVEVTY